MRKDKFVPSQRKGAQRTKRLALSGAADDNRGTRWGKDDCIHFVAYAPKRYDEKLRRRSLSG